jgi:hypothetical protein
MNDNKLEELLDKYHKKIIYRIDLLKINVKYNINIKKEEYDKLYLKFVKIRNNDKKIKNKIKNMSHTSLEYMINNETINYNFSLCKIILNNYFNHISKENTLLILDNKHNFVSNCNTLLIKDASELPKQNRLYDLIIINFRRIDKYKKYTGTINFDYKHIDQYIKLLIFSLNNINKKGYISIYIGVSIEPCLRDLILLLNHYSDSYIYSLNYFFGLDSLSSSIVFYNFHSKNKLMNELKNIFFLKKQSHSFLEKNKNTKKNIKILSEVNTFLLNRYLSYSKWYDTIKFNNEIKKKIIDYSINTVIYHGLKPTKYLFDLINNTKEKIIKLPNNNTIKVFNKLNINRGFKIYNFININKIKKVLQLGMNYGNLVPYIIASVLKNNGDITLIIPKQKTIWNNIGINKLKKNKIYNKIKTIYDNTNYSLAKLISLKKKFNMIYINDWHKSSYSFLNIFYSILLLNNNGYLLINKQSKEHTDEFHKKIVELDNLYNNYIKRIDITPKNIKSIIAYKKINTNKYLLQRGKGHNNYDSVYVPLIEGLGNKIFLFAASFVLSKKRNSDLVMGLYSSGHTKAGSNSIHYIFPKLRNKNRKLKHNISFLKELTKSHNVQIYNEYNPEPTSKKKILMTGYFQGYLYFKKYMNELKNILKFNKDIISVINPKYKNFFTKKDKKIIGVHVRHGDMYKMLLNTPRGYVRFPILKKKYYIDAFKKIGDLNNFKIIYFTDDAHKWIENDLLLFKNEHMISYKNSTDDDLYMMSQCDYLICSNSTLSYWGGILGKDKKVIAPKYLMNIGDNNNLKFDNKEYYPPEWIILDNLESSIWELKNNNIKY